MAGQYKERVALLQQTVEEAYTQLDEMRLDIESKNSGLEEGSGFRVQGLKFRV